MKASNAFIDVSSDGRGVHSTSMGHEAYDGGGLLSHPNFLQCRQKFASTKSASSD
jgi:hypothetical protein